MRISDCGSVVCSTELLGPMMGPVLGGWLTEYVSLRAIFLINAPVGVMACLGLMVFARALYPGHASQFDARGVAFVSITLAAFQHIGRASWMDTLRQHVSTSVVVGSLKKKNIER